MKEERSQAPAIQTPTRRQALVNAALAIGACSAFSIFATAAPAEDISRNSESLHQALVFKANRKRIYEIFTSTALFDKMTHDIQSKQVGTSTASHPTEISHDLGGAFSLFGGRILCRPSRLIFYRRHLQASPLA